MLNRLISDLLSWEVTTDAGMWSEDKQNDNQTQISKDADSNFELSTCILMKFFKVQRLVLFAPVAQLVEQ